MRIGHVSFRDGSVFKNEEAYTGAVAPVEREGQVAGGLVGGLNHARGQRGATAWKNMDFVLNFDAVTLSGDALSDGRDDLERALQRDAYMRFFASGFLQEDS